jgi:hypothetical protein
MLTISILSIFSIVDSAFSRVHPVIWRKTDTPVIKGYMEVDVTVKFGQPCIAFLDAMNSTKLKQGYVLRWCQLHQYTGFTEPIKEMCKKNNAMKIKKKRFVITTAVLGIVAVVSTFSLGIGALALSESISNKHEIEHTRALLATELSEMQSLKTSVININEATSNLIREYSRLAKEAQTLSEEISDCAEIVPYASHTISVLVNRVMSSRLLMQQVKEEWQHNHVGSAFMNLFNVSLPCGQSCELSTARDLRCGYEQERNKRDFRSRLRKKLLT